MLTNTPPTPPVIQSFRRYEQLNAKHGFLPDAEPQKLPPTKRSRAHVPGEDLRGPPSRRLLRSRHPLFPLSFDTRTGTFRHLRRRPGFISLRFRSPPARASRQEPGRKPTADRGRGADGVTVSRLSTSGGSTKVCVCAACVSLNTFGCEEQCTDNNKAAVTEEECY